MEISLTGYQCHRCYHQWRPRARVAPKRCPKCKSPYWDRPRRQEVPHSKKEVDHGFSLDGEAPLVAQEAAARLHGRWKKLPDEDSIVDQFLADRWEQARRGVEDFDR